MFDRAMVLLESLSRRYWIACCVGPLLLLLGYQLIKGGLGWNFVAHLGRPETVQPDALLLLVIAFAGALLMVWRHWWWGRWLPLLAATVLIAASTGVWLQGDRDLRWEGNDVSANNYQAALLALENGPAELIATWNARANPYVEPNYVPYGQELTAKIEAVGLGWIAGTRWDRLDLPQDNNRMHMQPPGYPLALAGWMALFGRGHHVALAFEMLVKVLLLVVASVWAWRYVPPEATLDRVAVSLLLATAPPMALFVQPFANELGALLALIAFGIGSEVRGARRLLAFGLAGILLALAAYTNFFYLITLLAGLVALALWRPAWSSGLLLGVTAGAATVLAGLLVLGYYPWLTYLTISQAARYYRATRGLDILSGILDFAYFGFPLLIVAGLGVLAIPRLRGKPALPWMASLPISLAAGTYQLFALGPTSRYMMGFLFLMVPLLALTVRRLDLTGARVVAIPIANLAFVFLVVFL